MNKELVITFANRSINHAGAYYRQWTTGELYGYKAIYRHHSGNYC